MSGEEKSEALIPVFLLSKAVRFSNRLLEVQEKHKHIEMAHWLKSELGVSHGHVNTLVAYFHSKQDRQAAW